MKSETQLKKILNDACIIADEAGSCLLKYQKKLSDLKVDFKEAQGAVSEADIETENFIIKHLKKILPSADILAEESIFFSDGGKEKSFFQWKEKEWSWVIDPLDGTHNFLNGLDYFAVCIALLHRGKPILGCVHRPRTRETFTAISNQGAFIKRKGKKIKKIFISSNKKPLKHALLVTGFATEKGKLREKEFELFYQIMKECRGVRRMGSAALDLCFVAEGLFDAFWERGLAPWDVAASGIICQEAGVKVTTYTEEKFDPFQSTIIACRNPLYGLLIPFLQIDTN